MICIIFIRIFLHYFTLSISSVLIFCYVMDKSGISALFAAFPKEVSLYDRCVITVKRHQNNYFQGWTFAKMDEEEIPEEWRPRVEITDDNSHHLLKNELSRNKKLAFCFEQSINNNNGWAVSFKDRIKSGEFRSLTEIKDKASQLWKTHSTTYDARRAVHVPSLNGRGHQVKRSRRSTESEADYRRRIRTIQTTDTTGLLAASLVSFQPRCLRIFGMKRPALNTSLQERQETLANLGMHGEIQRKTVDDCRVALLLCDLYEALERQ